MALPWNYPIYVIPIDGGFASASDNDDPAPDQSLLVFSESTAAILFIASFNLLSAPKAINNDRELSWLLQALRAPVTKMLLDANPENPDTASGQLFNIQDLLNQLKPDLSPWNYPVFAIATDVGFVTIDGAAEDGEFLSAIAVFSSARRAHEYLSQSGDQGELCEIKNRDEARIFLEGVSPLVGAVALDPVIEDSRYSAKYCFALSTLLEKYLVSDK